MTVTEERKRQRKISDGNRGCIYEGARPEPQQRPRLGARRLHPQSRKHFTTLKLSDSWRAGSDGNGIRVRDCGQGVAGDSGVAQRWLGKYEWHLPLASTSLSRVKAAITATESIVANAIDRPWTNDGNWQGEQKDYTDSARLQGSGNLAKMQCGRFSCSRLSLAACTAETLRRRDIGRIGYLVVKTRGVHACGVSWGAAAHPYLFPTWLLLVG